MSKIIIENRAGISDEQALDLVKSVIKEGRISNNGRQYCYFATCDFPGGKVGISSFLNEKSDRFVVSKI